MSLWLQIKYLKFLPLDQFQDKGNHKYHFRCPICGDSKKSATKKRGWAYELKQHLNIKCYNCGYSSSFHKFLKYYYPTFFSDYLKEKFQTDGFNNFKHVKDINVDLFATEYDQLNLLRIKDLPVNHKAYQYLKNRLLPKEIFEEFYYSDNFSLWLNTEIEEGAINFKADSDRRIVIPFYNKYKKIFCIQGRSIDFADPKYITHKTDKQCDLIYGLENVDFTKKVYIVEGPLDSLFLKNCLAVSGALADLKNILKYTSKENVIIIPDNDRNNKYSSTFITRVIKAGFKTVIWPNNTQFKDINDAVKKGLTSEEIECIIKLNTFEGLMAFSKFKMRRM